MIWWKLTLDKSGAILTCEQVEHVEKNGKLTCFVEAPTKARACSSAKAWYAARKEADRQRAKATAEKRRKAGRCPLCGKRPPAPIPGRRCCDECLQKQKESQERSARGEARPRHETPGAARDAVRDSHHRSAARKLHAATVLEVLDRAGPARLRLWLVELIEKGVAEAPF